ncbi:MAG: single-stranded DNA-binding protein [Chloroflexi bacterium]|nr:single-stranded DNA-binding protein [Chloroflexota bacterium]
MAVHNQVELLGKLVSEPELLPTRIGRGKLVFRLAVHRPPEMPAKWDTDGGRAVRRPDHVTVVMFGAEVARLQRQLYRGMRVLVVGGLVSRDITVRGEERTVNEVVARRIEMLDPLREDDDDDSGDSDSA